MQINPEFPTYIDSTMRSSFINCPRKFYYEHVLGCASPYQSEHLHFGRIFAGALQTVREAFYAEGVSEDVAHNRGLEYVLQSWGDFEPSERSVKTMENCVSGLGAYLHEWPLTNDPLIPYRSSADAKPWIEFTTAIPIEEVRHPETDEPLVYVCRMDMISVLAETCNARPWDAKQLWVVDDKTTSQMGATWAQQWRLRGQFIGYVWACQHNQLPAVGACVRGTAVYRAQSPRCQQAFVQVSHQLVDRWYLALVHDLKRMVNYWRAPGGMASWHQALADPCQHYGGCSFLQVCELDEPKPFLEANYVENRWNPLEVED